MKASLCNKSFAVEMACQKRSAPIGLREHVLTRAPNWQRELFSVKNQPRLSQTDPTAPLWVSTYYEAHVSDNKGPTTVPNFASLAKPQVQARVIHLGGSMDRALRC